MSPKMWSHFARYIDCDVEEEYCVAKNGRGPDKFEGWKHDFEGHVRKFVLARFTDVNPSMWFGWQWDFSWGMGKENQALWLSLCRDVGVSAWNLWRRRIRRKVRRSIRRNRCLHRVRSGRRVQVWYTKTSDKHPKDAKIMGLVEVWRCNELEGGGRFAEHVFREHIAQAASEDEMHTVRASWVLWNVQWQIRM